MMVGLFIYRLVVILTYILEIPPMFLIRVKTDELVIRNFFQYFNLMMDYLVV